MTYSVAVIGAGNIAAGFDKPGDAQILTHLHAIAAEPRLTCAGIFDLNRAIAEQRATQWNVPFAAELDRLFDKPVDIAVVASPDETHTECLHNLLDRDVKLVLCEKPLATTAAQAKEVVEAYAHAGRALAVNYQRRFEPTVLDLKRALDAGKLGRPIAGAVWYSKGVLHNGSHAIDLLRFLFGEVSEVCVLRRVADWRESDPTVSGLIMLGKFAVDLIGADEQFYSLFEIDLLFEKARYRYTQSGTRLERYETRPDPLFPGYTELLRVSEEPSGLSRALLGCHAGLANFLDGQAPLANAAADVVRTQQICEALQTLRFNKIWRPAG